MKFDLNQKLNYCWRNPRNGRLCYVAFEGLTVVRVEDIVKPNESRNMRLMSYETLLREMLGLKRRARGKNGVLPIKPHKVEEHYSMLQCG